MTDNIFDPWIAEIAVIIALPLVAYISNWFRVRTKKMKANAEQAERNEADIKLIKRTLLIITKIIDKQTKEAHGSDPEIACLTKDLLTDRILNGERKQAI